MNTRSGRVLILAILALALAALTWQLTHMNNGGQAFDGTWAPPRPASS